MDFHDLNLWPRLVRITFHGRAHDETEDICRQGLAESK
jgi:hypothetical protein